MTRFDLACAVFLLSACGKQDDANPYCDRTHGPREVNLSDAIVGTWDCTSPSTDDVSTSQICSFADDGSYFYSSVDVCEGGSRGIWGAWAVNGEDQLEITLDDDDEGTLVFTLFEATTEKLQFELQPGSQFLTLYYSDCSTNCRDKHPR